MKREIHRPWLVQVELVRGCNMACKFCANVSLPKQKKFMSVDDAYEIASNLADFGPRQRIAIGMRGEPTLHPDLCEITSIFKAIIPELQITLITNGIKVDHKLVKEWFRAGGNIVAIDSYNNSYAKHKEKFFTAGVPTVDYRDFNIWTYHNSTLKKVILIPDLEMDSATTRTFTNQCDYIPAAAYQRYGISRPDYDNPLKKKCTLPFRELAIHYDGTVPLCCKDWLGKSTLYNVLEGDVKGYWFGCEQLNIIRTLLANKTRTFFPCNRCTYFGGYRQGFLPTMKTLNEAQIKSAVRRLNA